MKKTKNTKGLTGSMTNIDADELRQLKKERDKYKRALEEIATGKISWSKPENMGKTQGEVFQEIAEGVLGE